ncbi:GNAT family N-acetyltransferase [Luteimonas saliphila]|uniref:GNAT family N-acetyltransferase n=1 Tax=Luteimonas saliphila TaxID=2804919 RepID=UPI00192E0DAF|nr:GNAT family N-acetyltransferase [Luteimonas saliphila]
MLTIEQVRHQDLPHARREQLRLLASEAFDQFAIVRETRWAAPDWTFLGKADDGGLACFYHLVERAVRIDGQPVAVAGLNNLITTRAYRGRGLASELLAASERAWFSSLDARCGLLLCAEALVPFYQRLGWQRVRSEVRFEQPAGVRTWTAECMMLDPTRAAIDPTVIDLCGLPW